MLVTKFSLSIDTIDSPFCFAVSFTSCVTCNTWQPFLPFFFFPSKRRREFKGDWDVTKGRKSSKTFFPFFTFIAFTCLGRVFDTDDDCKMESWSWCCVDIIRYTPSSQVLHHLLPESASSSFSRVLSVFLVMDDGLCHHNRHRCSLFSFSWVSLGVSWHWYDSSLLWFLSLFLDIISSGHLIQMDINLPSISSCLSLVFLTFLLLTSFSFSYSVFSLGCCSRTSSLGSHSQQETCLEYIFSLSSQLVWTSLYVFMSHDFFSSDNFFLLPLNDNLIVISLWWWKRKKKFASGLSMDSGLWMENMSRHHRHSLQSQSSIDTFPVFSFLLKHILT